MTLTFRGAASLDRAIGQDPRQPRQGQDSILPKAGTVYPLGPQAVPSSEKASHGYFTRAAGPRVPHSK